MAECPWPVAGCAALGWIASFTLLADIGRRLDHGVDEVRSCPPSTARSSSRRRCASAMKAGSARVASKALRKAATRSAGTPGCIGILNHLFFWPEQYRRTGGMSIVFLFDENPDVASAGSGGAAVGGARSVPDHAARSNSERAAPSACVGRRLSAPQIVSTRRAGARGGPRVGRSRIPRS
jgi:hypothetical protein